MLLALDTSTHKVGLALYDGVQVLGEMMWTSRQFHTVELAPAIAELLARVEAGPSQLSAVAVAIGPGSFTGLRIGLALAKGLALAQRLPLVGIPTLDILAVAQPRLELPMAAVLRAGRGRLAVGWYKVVEAEWRSNGSIEVLTADELNQRIHVPTLVCGELSDEERRLLGRRRKTVLLASPSQSTRRPGWLAELGWRRWQAGQVDDAATLSPIYLHHSLPIPE